MQQAAWISAPKTSTMRPSRPELSAHEAAAAMLGRRALSKKELTEKLAAKGFSSIDVEEAVSRMEEIRALDDIAYGCMLARHYYIRGWGPGRVKAELHKRGVPREYWEEAIASAGEFAPIAENVLSKKLGNAREPQEINKAAAFLARRGFSWEEINAAIRRLNEAEE